MKLLNQTCVLSLFAILTTSLLRVAPAEETTVLRRVGGWELRTIDGYPSYAISFTANPGTYRWEAAPANEDTMHTVTDGQLIGNASDHTVRAVVQGNIDNNWTVGDESLYLRVSSKGEDRKLWAFVGGKDEAGIPEATFSGTASLTFDVSCSGTAGYDGGYVTHPAVSKSAARIGAAWSAGDAAWEALPDEDNQSYEQDANLSVAGWSDNKVNDSSVSQVAAGSASAPGFKIFGVLIDFDQTPATSDSLTYLHGATITARDSVGPMHVMEAANIEYGWSGTAVAETNLYTDGNTATGNAEASVTADITLHIAIPEPMDDGELDDESSTEGESPGDSDPYGDENDYSDSPDFDCSETGPDCHEA